MTSSAAELRATMLAWLGDLAMRGGGYLLHGRAGWVSPADAAARYGRPAMEALGYLASKQRLDRVNIAPTGFRPFWIYRIAAVGMAAAGVEMPAPWDATAEVGTWAVLTDSEWLAVEILQQAAQTRARLRFPAQEPGWRSLREIREAAEARNGSVHAQDVYEVERLGLVEKRRGAAAAGVQQIHFFHATSHGLRVERLVWHEPSSPNDPGAAK